MVKMLSYEVIEELCKTCPDVPGTEPYHCVIKGMELVESLSIAEIYREKGIFVSPTPCGYFYCVPEGAEEAKEAEEAAE